MYLKHKSYQNKDKNCQSVPSWIINGLIVLIMKFMVIKWLMSINCVFSAQLISFCWLELQTELTG